MKIIEETSLENFKAWSGGKDTLDVLSHEDCENLERYIEELYPEGATDTEVNDFLWFEREQIAEVLGYRNADAMLEQDDENWEEHARTILTKEYEEKCEDYMDDWISDEFSEGMSDNDIITDFGKYLEERLKEEVAESYE